MPWRIIHLFMAALLLAVLACDDDTPGGVATGTGTGTGSGTPTPRAVIVPRDYPTIQAAIDDVNDGDRIFVVTGIYTGEGNRDISLRGKDILLQSENGAGLTIIDCEEQGRGFVLDRREPSTAVIEGFSVVNGLASSETTGSDVGGAVYLSNDASPLFRDCVFEGNRADGRGGAVYVSHASPAFERCDFSGNESGADGGALGFTGGQGSSVTLRLVECTFNRNGATEAGGAIWLDGGAVTMSGCSLRLNAAHSGGAVASGARLSMASCVVADNLASSSSSGLWLTGGTGAVGGTVISGNRGDGLTIASGLGGVPLVLDCIIDSNSGNAIAAASDSLRVEGCTIVRNGTGLRLTTAHLQLRDSIVAFNEGEAMQTDRATLAAACSDLYGNPSGNWPPPFADQLGRDGNISRDPLFCDLVGGDLRLHVASPCVAGASPECDRIGAQPVGCGR